MAYTIRGRLDGSVRPAYTPGKMKQYLHPEPRQTTALFNTPHIELPSSTVGNALGVGDLRTRPSYYNGIVFVKPEWFRLAKEVNIFDLRSGPFGLQVGRILTRQGISFRIIGTAIKQTFGSNGSSNGIQTGRVHLASPAEQMQSTREVWSYYINRVDNEAIEEDPLIHSTAVYRDGGKMEGIYIRDLLRHRIVVERETLLVDSFEVCDDRGRHSVQAILKNIANGKEETVLAKYQIGAAGAASGI
ncbi:hypothetical protein BJX63DRAFT_430257 [Aspergillus granulosus]|uniref:Uncharacterized protein n=1 Tax=Aspergillus granulosus TaxID=176169 RepID=A0ABR4HPB4_9EURO